MDLGCLDLGCLDKKTKEDTTALESVLAAVNVGKSKVSKETSQSALNSVNKSNLQMKKAHRRSSSPLNWFPRRKTDSYLKRKIRLLQEVGGMNSTLDETLGDSNPHYSRVLREKIAAREAACKAMEARKAAMVEASWCRILSAARIQSKEAESLLLEAEKNVADAFEAAAAMGVIMYDRPDCPRKPCEVESSSVNMGGSTTHTVTASFETAFEVDKEVAVAVKAAFIRLANCPSSLNKAEFRDLLWKINQNPDSRETNECSSGCQPDAGSELESESQRDDCGSKDINLNVLDAEMRQGKWKSKKGPDIDSPKLVDIMFERLKCLQEDELASLATIVATCGLNAVLLEVENTKHHDPESSMECFKDGKVRRKQVVTELPSLDKFLVKHVSKLEKEVQDAKNKSKNDQEESKKLGDSEKRVDMSKPVPDLGSILVKHASKLEKEIEVAKKTSRKEFEMKPKQSGNALDATDVPSLDTVLVKHMSRLEREVQEAKDMRKNHLTEGGEKNPKSSMKREDMSNTSSGAAQDLGNILVKHSSKLEKEINEEKKKLGSTFDNTEGTKHSLRQKDVPKGPSLDECLVKHVSRLEREVQEAKNRRKNDLMESRDASNAVDSLQDAENMDENGTSSLARGEQVDKENVSLNGNAGWDSESSLDSILVKPIHRLEREKMQASPLDMRYKTKSERKKEAEMAVSNAGWGSESSLDSILVKPIHRLEREKMQASPLDMGYKTKSERKKEAEMAVSNAGWDSESSLDSILVKPIHRLEREKMQASPLEMGYKTKSDRKKEAEMAVSNCDPLDKVLVKRVSRLEKEKIEFGSRGGMVEDKRKDTSTDNSAGSLDQILVKHQSRLEKEKANLVQQPEDRIKHSETRRAAKVRELQDAWGGSDNSAGGLDQILVKHQSRLEKEKLNLVQQPEDRIKHPETRQAAKVRELQDAWGGLSLGNSIRPHLSRLEREKLMQFISFVRAAWIKAEQEEQSRAQLEA